MNEQATRVTLLSRLGRLFRGGRHHQEELDLTELPALPGISDEPSTESCVEMASDPDDPAERTTFLRPWAKRDATMEGLQNGVAGLTDLMGSIRDNLERNSERQDELLNYLSALPAAIESLPETQRVQGEALKAIQQSIEQQNGQQSRLSNVLERMYKADGDHARALDMVREQIVTIAGHEGEISRNLSSVGAALETVNATAQTSAATLQTLRENLDSRDGELERIISRQNTRFTTMLAVAIVLSMAALTAVVVFGYLGYETLSRLPK